MKQENKIKLSVIVTFYNQISYVERAIESILEQEVDFLYEILIGDDGSSDGTYEFILDKYGKYDNIAVFRQERDESEKIFPPFRHSRLIVRLLREVKGEYFSILDGDDYYCDIYGFYRKIDILDSTDNQDCVLIKTNFKYVYEESGKEQVVHANPLIEKRSFEESVFTYKSNKADGYVPLATMVIRSKILAFLEEANAQDISDVDFYLWAHHFGKRYYDHHVTFAYNQHVNMFTKSNTDTIRRLREIMQADVLNSQWDNQYYKHFSKQKARAIIALFDERESLHKNIDYDIWLPYVSRYHNGWGYAILNYSNYNYRKRFVLWLKILILRIWISMNSIMYKTINISKYVFECICFTFSTKVSTIDKIERIKTVIYMKARKNK